MRLSSLNSRASLQVAGQLTVVALLPAPGADLVRFLVKGDKERGYRVFEFRHEGQAFVYDDMTLDPVTALEISVFRLGEKPISRNLAAGDGFSVTLWPGKNPCSPKFIAKAVRIKESLPAKSIGIAALDFIAGCREALQENRIETFLSCFGPTRAKQFRELIGNLTPAQRSQFAESQFDFKGDSLLLAGGDLNILFFRRTAPAGNPVIGHLNVVGSGLSSFDELLDGLTSGVLDSVLSTVSFTEPISRMIR